MNTLLLAPHNDDETLFGTFTLLRYRPLVIVCLRSFRMGSPHYPGGMAINYETRELETEAAMAALGCEWEQWFHPDDRADWEMLAYDLEQVRDGRDGWDRVFAPAIEENGHDQHNKIGELADQVFGERVTHYLTYTARGKSHSATPVPFEESWVARKLFAMSCYASQAAHPATQKHFIDHGIREFYVTGGVDD